ncbi:hypothetical protein [Parasitella parasitica]|uniref:Uncharacterized protein n=1 Tax=Parasitella parasitica TaxID=35722 RepID=A0A0B7NBI6_9FUNG|nr:hypothetical protein [Parasitella parasitica]
MELDRSESDSDNSNKPNEQKPIEIYHDPSPSWDSSTSTSSNSSAKASKKSIEKGKQKARNSESLSPEHRQDEMNSKAAEIEGYGQDADKEKYEQTAGKVDKRIKRSKRINYDTRIKRSKRISYYTKGNWSTERKVILLNGYMTIRPFAAERGKVYERWDQLLDLVNSHEKAKLGTLQRLSCQRKVNQLMNFYAPLFDIEREKNSFSDELEEAAYNVFLMRSKLSEPKKDNISSNNDYTIPTATVRIHRLKRKINNVSTAAATGIKEEDNEHRSKISRPNDALAQNEYIQAKTEQDDAEEPLRPLDYLPYLETLKYLPAIANASNSIAQRLKK